MKDYKKAAVVLAASGVNLRPTYQKGRRPAPPPPVSLSTTAVQQLLTEYGTVSLTELAARFNITAVQAHELARAHGLSAAFPSQGETPGSGFRLKPAAAEPAEGDEQRRRMQPPSGSAPSSASSSPAAAAAASAPQAAQDRTVPAGVITPAVVQAAATVVATARTTHPGHGLCEKFALFVSAAPADSGERIHYPAINADRLQDVKFVYMLHNPLVPHSTLNEAGQRAVTFRALERAWQRLGLSPESLGIMVTELNPLTSLTGVIKSDLFAYDAVARASLSAALSPLLDRQGGTMVAFGRYTRIRWVRHWREFAQSGACMVDEDDDLILRMQFADGSRVVVYFAPHPSEGWLLNDMYRVLAKAHGLSPALLERALDEPLWRHIDCVERVAGGQFMSIEVDAEDGRFVLADGVITHNSTLDIMTERVLYAVLHCSEVDADVGHARTAQGRVPEAEEEDNEAEEEEEEEIEDDEGN
jgi:hypothetical protein